MRIEQVEEIEHTADWAIRVQGRDLEELFVNAARGMFGLLTDLETVEPRVERHVELEDYDTESLLVAWLNELLWFNEESELVFVSFEIASLTSRHLEAKAWGESVSDPRGHIKAVTFHDLDIIETADGREVTIVFDV